MEDILDLLPPEIDFDYFDFPDEEKEEDLFPQKHEETYTLDVVFCTAPVMNCFYDKSSNFDSEFYSSAYRLRDRNVHVSKRNPMKVTPVFLDRKMIDVLCFSRNYSLRPSGFVTLRIPISGNFLRFYCVKIELMGKNYKQIDSKWVKLCEQFMYLYLLMGEQQQRNDGKHKYVTIVNNRIKYISIVDMKNNKQPLILFDAKRSVEFGDGHLTLRVMFFYKSEFFVDKLKRNKILYNLRFSLLDGNGTAQSKFNVLNVLNCDSKKNKRLIQEAKVELFSVQKRMREEELLNDSNKRVRR
jgi:hypothetical protein